MANDPNRDLLPVKEDNFSVGKGLHERIDHQIIVKLSRCELEDRFLRLVDEKTDLKKLVNCQEEKIKRLGTKLLRLISEKKSRRKNLDLSKETEELNLRIIELEHENYTLRDRNTVLKQQLANHTRHIVTHPSLLRSNHTSPIMSVRQSATNQNEIIYESEMKNSATEAQLENAQLHIKELNEEIKSLHCKIDFLQQDIERNSLDSRKTKVTENIELIRLQRSLKQQSIQIAALQAQVKSAKINQRMLKEELGKAHSDNDEAVNLISLKQNEILGLCAKLEEKNLNRLEEHELRERIHDLERERNTLKERSEFLMKTIGIKSEEAEKANTLQRLLAEEKLRKEKLEAAYRETKFQLKKLQGLIFRYCNFVLVCTRREKPQVTSKLDLKTESKQTEIVKGTDKSSNSSENAGVKKNGLPFVLDSSPFLPEGNSECDDVCPGVTTTFSDSRILQEKFSEEKMKLQREMDYLREMLRSQTARCEAQQNQINRLMYELKLNEEKCDFLLQRERAAFSTTNLHHRNNGANENPSLLTKELDSLKIPENEMMLSNSGGTFSSLVNSDSFKINSGHPVEKASVTKKGSEFDSKKRFIDQVFLESSEEEELSDGKADKTTLMKKASDIAFPTSDWLFMFSFILETLESEKVISDGNSELFRKERKSENIKKMTVISGNTENKRKTSAESLVLKKDSVSQAKEKSQEMREESSVASTRSINHGFRLGETGDTIQIGIMWLRIDTTKLLWMNENIKLLFVDFSFLGMKGEDTETPTSLRKPETPDEKCEFNFYKNIDMTEDRKKTLNSLLDKPDMDLIVFKVVTDPERSYDDLECEDIGILSPCERRLVRKLNNREWCGTNFGVNSMRSKQCREIKWTPKKSGKSGELQGQTLGIKNKLITGVTLNGGGGSERCDDCSFPLEIKRSKCCGVTFASKPNSSSPFVLLNGFGSTDSYYSSKEDLSDDSKSISPTRMKDESDEDDNKKENESDDCADEYVQKLKHILDEIENLLKWKPNQDCKEGNLTSVGTTGTKEKIDKMAIPILEQISKELCQQGNASDIISKKVTKQKKCYKGSKSVSTKSGKNGQGSRDEGNRQGRNTPNSTPDKLQTGLWSSTTVGAEFNLTILPSMMLKVSLKSFKKHSLLNKKWFLQGLTLSGTGGPLMLAAVCPQQMKIASFLGERHYSLH
ncbi:hypothetical protein RUM44_011789 [Polyplax serrata]|uniref:RPGRIP1 C-terminal domain-containing protein n=1 Tax=Polyplax serrata TaxID=468196 RepID=A0ABR1AR02_POLSC